MPTLTPVLDLVKPTVGDIVTTNAWGYDLNDNFDKIDAAIGDILVDMDEPGAVVTVSDNPPSTPVPNQLWWDSSNGFLYIYYNDGNSTQWVSVTNGGTGGPATTISTSPPSGGTDGDVWYQVPA
jgi:hypothetical protein